MTNATSTSIKMEDGGEKSSKTLRDKLKDHYTKGSDGSRSKRFARVLFIFQAFTQLYVTLTYLIPFVFGDLDPFLQYCLKVLAWYLCIMGIANWLCILCYSNVYVPTKDRPDVDIHVYNDVPDRFHGNLALHREPYQDPIHPGNGHAVVDVSEKGGLPWGYCKKCQLHTPPRAHHCKFCHKCMLRRDHHCHLVGTCIGHWNQRYFVVLAGYGIVVGYMGAYMTISYLRHHHEEGQSLWNYLLPLAFVKACYGTISWLQVLLTFHAYMLCLFGPICNIYFLSQFSIIAQGKTLHEVFKKKPIKIVSSVKDNVKLVFGEYFIVNFIFPAQIIFKQENDGMRFDGVKLAPGHKPKLSEKRDN